MFISSRPKLSKHAEKKCGQTILKVHSFETFVLEIFGFVASAIMWAKRFHSILFFCQFRVSSQLGFCRMTRDYWTNLFLGRWRAARCDEICLRNFSCFAITRPAMVSDDQHLPIRSSSLTPWSCVRKTRKQPKFELKKGRVKTFGWMYRFRAWCKLSGWSLVCKFVCRILD